MHDNDYTVAFWLHYISSYSFSFSCFFFFRAITEMRSYNTHTQKKKKKAISSQREGKWKEESENKFRWFIRLDWNTDSHKTGGMSVIETFCFIPYEFFLLPFDLSSRLYLTNDPNAKNKKRKKRNWPILRFHMNENPRVAHKLLALDLIFSATIVFDIPKRKAEEESQEMLYEPIQPIICRRVSLWLLYRPCQYNIIHRWTARQKGKGRPYVNEWHFKC